MISPEEFVERLCRVGADRGPRKFPRKRRDREILMKSIVMLLDSARTYTEAEINEALLAWKAEVVDLYREIPRGEVPALKGVARCIVVRVAPLGQADAFTEHYFVPGYGEVKVRFPGNPASARNRTLKGFASGIRSK